MKVFCCKNQNSYGGGLILVAANSKEEAYLTSAYDDKTSYLFDWFDDNGAYSYEPDGDIDHCTSDTFRKPRQSMMGNKNNRYCKKK